jgi:SAM-dependent methyltransferase
MYDLAFGYRSYEDEVDFLLGQHQRLHSGKAPKRTLELAAGPARHTIAALQSGRIQAGIALDNSPEMVDYGTESAQMELDIDTFESFSYLKDDMTSFKLSETQLPIDSAWILLGSLQHLTENDQVISCFQSIHQCMSEGGSLIIELPHPRETFSLVECTRNGWEVPLEDENGEESGELKIIWGDDNDDFDPIKQVRQFTVAMEVVGASINGDSSPDLQNVREIVPMRHFTAQEIDVLARLCGFKVESMFGALDENVSVNDGLEAFRLVCVLQKK